MNTFDSKGTSTVETAVILPLVASTVAVAFPFAVILKAGIDGIKNQIDPGEPVSQNIYTMSKGEKKSLGIESLPSTLNEALLELDKDEVIKSALTNHSNDCV